MLRCIRRGVSNATAAAGVILCALAAIQSFGARGQVVGWACLATVVYLLEAEGARIKTLHFKAELSSLISKVKGL